MQDIIHSLWFGLACLMALGAVLTHLLRAARIPGGTPSAAIAAGIISGILLGTTVMGKSNPDVYEHWFVGGVEEKQIYEKWKLQRDLDIAAMQSVSVTDAAITEYIEGTIDTGTNLLMDSHKASSEHQRLLFHITVSILLIWLILAALANTKTGSTIWPINIPRLILISLFSGVPVFFLVYFFEHWSIPSFVAAMLVTIGTPTAIGDIATRKNSRRLLSISIWFVLVPLLIALGIKNYSIDNSLAHRDFWIMFIAIAIFSHDGRWLGAWLEQRMATPKDKRHPLWFQSSSALDPGVAVPQAVLPALFLSSMVVEPHLIFALILSALIIELCQPIRQPVARWMDEQFSKPIDSE